MMSNQDSTGAGMTATSISAAERDVRQRLDVVKNNDDDDPLLVNIGVLRTLMRDLDTWRGIVSKDMNKFSFYALMQLAKLILETVYPEDIFLPRKVHTLRNEGDLPSVHYIVVQDRNDGLAFVSLMRELIKHIEKDRPRDTAHQ